MVPQGRFHPPPLFAWAKAYPRTVRNGPLRRESAAETTSWVPGPQNAFLKKLCICGEYRRRPTGTHLGARQPPERRVGNLGGLAGSRAGPRPRNDGRTSPVAPQWLPEAWGALFPHFCSASAFWPQRRRRARTAGRGLLGLREASRESWEEEARSVFVGRWRVFFVGPLSAAHNSRQTEYRPPPPPHQTTNNILI